MARIEGENGYIMPKTINGENVEAGMMHDKKAMSMDDEEAEMRADAEKSDRIY